MTYPDDGKKVDFVSDEESHSHSCTENESHSCTENGSHTCTENESHTCTENENDNENRDGNEDEDGHGKEDDKDEGEQSFYNASTNDPLIMFSEAQNANDFIVEFEDRDPEKALNWSLRKRLYHTMIYGLATFTAQLNSTTTSPSVPHLKRYFNVSREKAVLSTSLYVLGIAFGPMFAAPLSEMYGRKVAVFGALLVSMFFTLGSAGCRDFASLLVTRFFAGFFGGSPVVSSGGVLADLWPASVRSIAMVFYAIFVTCGVNIGPVLTSLLTFEVAYSGEWRWALWFSCILQGLLLIIAALTVTESFPGVVLAHKAKRIRKETGNWAYHARHEEWDLSLKEYFSVHFMRPFAMLATPIVFALALFASYVFGILYLIMSSLPLTFRMTRNWSDMVSNLPIIAVLIGILFGAVINVWGGLRYRKILLKNNGKMIPEERFPPMMFFSWLMPAGLFIFAWTSKSSIHWIVPCVGLSFLGVGFFVIFQGCLNYLVDSFTKYSASAIAANTFLRSILGGVFPLFGHALFVNLGVSWGASTIAFIALGMIPIPFVLYAFGPKIRAKNPYMHRLS